MSERYKVVEGSESAHCCFKATVVDTHPNSPFYDESNWVCECFDMESAQKIADLLNATPQPAEKQPDVAQLVEALERLVGDVERATHVEFGGTPWLKEKMAEIDYARAALAAHRKKGGQA